jgi:hypothetical protein
VRRSLRAVSAAAGPPPIDECFAVILPTGGDESVAQRVGQHARDLYARVLEEMPERGAAVCTFLAEYARSAALCAYMQSRALEEGLDSGQSMALVTQAARVGTQAAGALEAAWKHAARVAVEGAGAEGDGSFAVMPKERGK